MSTASTLSIIIGFRSGTVADVVIMSFLQPIPHVWANRTMWSNVTSNKESDSKNQTKVMMEPPVKTRVDTPVKTRVNTTEDDKSDADIGDISISKFSDVTNSTLVQNNITKMINDTHQYYNSTFIVDTDICKKYWVDMDNHPELKINYLLSQSHRRAAVRFACNPFDCCKTNNYYTE